MCIIYRPSKYERGRFVTFVTLICKDNGKKSQTTVAEAEIV